ncbi:MAG TPA: hypothetical protein DCY46_07590 [Lactobacillus sp.]|nr:hypothetical protein [Lactobacillus sp.]
MLLFNRMTRTIRRVFPGYFPLWLVLFALIGGFGWTQIAQQQYITAYRTQLQAAPAKWRAQFGQLANERQGGRTLYAVYQAMIARELHALNRPRMYTRLYLQTIGQTEPANDIPNFTNPAPFSNQSVQLPWNLPTRELANTMLELDIVVSQNLVPMHPARILLNERSFSESQQPADATYKKQLANDTRRFYEYGWYYLEHTLTTAWPTVFLAILITLFGWWPLVGQSRLTRSNDLLTMLGVPPRQQYWRSYWLSFFAGTASTLFIGGLFLLASIPIHGVGSWNYPIMVWHSASERDFVPLLQLMSAELVIFLANWGFYLAVAQLLRQFIRRPVLLGAANLGVILAAASVPNVWWSTLAYLRISEVAEHYAFLRMGAGNVGLTVLVLVVSSFLVLGLGWAVQEIQQRWQFSQRRTSDDHSVDSAS